MTKPFMLRIRMSRYAAMKIKKINKDQNDPILVPSPISMSSCISVKERL